jgi:hypothetical protein
MCQGFGGDSDDDNAVKLFTSTSKAGRHYRREAAAATDISYRYFIKESNYVDY